MSDQGFDPSRREAVRSAIFRSYAVKAASDRATEAEKAGQWLSTYGANCVGKDAASIAVRLDYAGSCVGASEAQAYIRNAIYVMLPTIIATAEEMVERDMEALLALLPPNDSGAEGIAPTAPPSSIIERLTDE